MTSIFEGLNPPKQGLTSNQNKGPHLGSRTIYHIYHIYTPHIKYIYHIYTIPYTNILHTIYIPYIHGVMRYGISPSLDRQVQVKVLTPKVPNPTDAMWSIEVMVDAVKRIMKVSIKD